MIRIPTRFRLFGRTIDVVLQPDLILKDDVYGWAVYRERVIRLQALNELQTLDGQGETFCHELIHWLFYSVREDDLRGNEKLVGMLGALLYEALSTMEYE